MISGVFTIPFSATEQVFATATAEGLPEPASSWAVIPTVANAPAVIPTAVIPTAAASPDETPTASRPGTRFQLEFIAGPENQLAGAAARAVIDSDTMLSSISPLVLYGPAGCGKSHLAQGIAFHWRRVRRSARGVVYMSASDWSPKVLPLKRFLARPEAEATDAQEAIPAERQRTTYDIDLLIVEDVHQLRQTPASLAHFRAVFDELSARGVPLVFTSRVPPKEIKSWPHDLRARLQSGMLVPIAPPAEAARHALLRAMAELWQIRLTPAAAERLAVGLAEPAPRLLTSLAKLCADVAGLQRPISEDDAVRFLSRQQVQATVELPQIGKAVLRKFGLQLNDLTGKSRRRHIVAARSVLMYLARELTTHSFAGIGRYCGGRDHTTTLHNCRKIAEQINSDAQLRQTIDELRRELQPA